MQWVRDYFLTPIENLFDSAITTTVHALDFAIHKGNDNAKATLEFRLYDCNGDSVCT